MSVHSAPCSRRTSQIVCGGKKKKAEKRLKEGRKRLADVIQELQTVTAFDQTRLQSRLEEIDTVLCGECASSSSSSSSEDEGMSDMMQASESADAPHEAVSNVVPLPSKVKAEKGMGAVTRQSAAELVLDLPEGASVSVCQGKTCLKRGSNVLMAELQSAGATAASVTACKCLDKCKLGPNVEVAINGKRQIVQVHSPVLALVG
ncbi:hypothetical protein CVIRNUC_002554 [Coccomyxa viridis]|uniref:Uncharacterized protein n=1 Tax=Coccomyxa viridis TaxID=1274662 RepID=A0AAV1HZB0_9CHLO|nr:hypothetical protein CVIRNUC_002554 [Coccomyxa viridis]